MHELGTAVATCTTDLVIVSPEVGMGVVPATPAGRLFRDELGTLNAALAKSCGRTVLVVAGVAVTLGSDEPLGTAAELPAAPAPVVAAATPIGGAIGHAPASTNTETPATNGLPSDPAAAAIGHAPVSA